MSSNEGEIRGTELIDVEDIPTGFEDEELTLERGEEVSARPDSHASNQGMMIADLKDRFAALMIDLSFLYALYWILLPIYRAIAIGQAAGPIPLLSANGLIFHSLFLLLALIWFLLSEFAFGASPGKALCHLAIRKVDGQQATFGAVLLRNLLRPVDLILMPCVVTFAAMEWSPWHRRIGDLVGQTVVIKKLSRASRQYAVSLEILSSASRRAVAFLFDLLLLATFAFGYGLLLSPDEPLMSMILVVLAPLFLIAFLTIPEWLTKTSPGKWLLGLSICHEDGTSIGLATALVRNLWKIFDANPFGFLTALFSLRRQRPGDAAAGSIVIKTPRSWSGLAGLAITLLIATAVCYGGLTNRTSFLSRDFHINFLPAIDLHGTSMHVEKLREESLNIQRFQFAAGSPEVMRRPSIYQPGEMLYMVFDVGGYAVKEGKAWIQEDLSIIYPDGSVGLKLENINDFNAPSRDKGFVRFENNIKIPDESLPGRYTITITLRDRQARREIKEQRFFYITPPDGQNQ